ncbi:MAG: LysR family transcriptional regulator [Solirubrobacteraceae bacterium]
MQDLHRSGDARNGGAARPACVRDARRRAALRSRRRRLGVSQPTLSRHVRRLERELGVVLAHRTSRTVRLTDAGHELATALPGALRQLERTLAATRAVADGGWAI